MMGYVFVLLKMIFASNTKDNAKINAKNLLEIIRCAGSNILPIVEGGKGVGVSNGITAGNFAKNNAVGTFSGVNADYINDNGEYEPIIYKGTTRLERHEELVEYAIKGAVSQAKRAFDIACGKGKVHMNVLWEMGGASRVLQGVLERAKGLINGVTCGAGMPYQLAEIAAKYQVHYYPIVSSMRAFKILWKRSYEKFSLWLGAVVYECPWRAGGHNGLSNAENPLEPQSPYHRIAELRKFMNEVGLNEVPIILAGGVWHVKDHEEYLNNPEIGPIMFQFGSRPVFTQESPVSNEWKQKMLTLNKGDILLNKFSPTGFYSSAVVNKFLKKLINRSNREVAFSSEQNEKFTVEFRFGPRGRAVFFEQSNFENIKKWIEEGNSEILKTPDNTVVFVSPAEKNEIVKDQQDCMGCLSYCSFSNWSTHFEGMTTGKTPDPRSFCIQKTLQNAIHTNDIENNLMFSGSVAYKINEDPWYQGGKFMPTIKQLVERITTGY